MTNERKLTQSWQQIKLNGGLLEGCAGFAHIMKFGMGEQGLLPLFRAGQSWKFHFAVGVR